MNTRTPWDERYSSEVYIYGKEPNDFFKSCLDGLAPGKILMPGEGEGRNAVYAALRGWTVTAFDSSAEGRKKAQRLSEERGVKISYGLISYENYDFPPAAFDAIGLFFTHMPSADRKVFHQRLISSLKPGGVLILEGFHKDQLRFASGGPRSIDFLWGEEELLSDFSVLDIRALQVQERVLSEGSFHQGRASVIQLYAYKK